MQEIPDLFQETRIQDTRMSTESIDSNTRVSTLDHAGRNRTAFSPFFIAAIGMTVALVVIAAAIAVVS